MYTNDDIMQFIRRVVLSDDTDPGLKAEGLSLLIRHSGTHRILLDNGSFIYLTEDEHYEVQTLVDGCNRIESIKTFRRITGLGLKEAKHAVEDARNFRQPK